MSSMCRATMSSAHSKAAAQCAADVSKARTLGAGLIVDPGVCSGRDGPDLDHLGDVVAQQVLDAHLERQRRRGAAGAGPLHVQVDNAAIKTMKGDVATVLSNRRTHACVQQILDLVHDLTVLAVVIGM